MTEKMDQAKGKSETRTWNLRRRSKSWLSILLVAVLVFSMALPSFAAGYADSEGHWAEALIDEWSEAGVLTGASGAFRPDDYLTRAELAVSLYEIFWREWTVRAENKFEDVYGTAAQKMTATQADSMLRANAAGVMLGTEKDGMWYFYPTEAITREETAVMLCRAFGIEAAQGLPEFTDIEDISDWAAGAVYALAEKGYIEGYDGQFHPQDNITRAEILSIIEKMCADYPDLAERKLESDEYEYVDIKLGEVQIADSKFQVMTSENPYTPVLALEDFTYEENRTKDITIRFYSPLESTGNDPVLIYVFGGAWVRGDYTRISSDMELLDLCLRNGIAVAGVSYTVATETIYPQPLHELKAQIRYLRANAEELGIDPDNFGITGTSAGSYWAALLGVTGDSEQHEGTLFGNTEYSSSVQWVVDQYGASDMMTCYLQIDPYIQGYSDGAYMHNSPYSVEAMLFGLNRYKSDAYPNGVSMADLRSVKAAGDKTHELWDFVELVEHGSPIYHVDSGDPKFLIYHGTEDVLIPIYQNIDLYTALRMAGVEADYLIAAYTGHSTAHAQHMLARNDWILKTAFGTE